MALAPICGPDDVLTPDHLHLGEDDALKANARNWCGRYNPISEVLSSQSAAEAARSVRDYWKRPLFYNHIRASSIRGRISSDAWNTYYKFCFERNPWEKLISFYFWKHRHSTEVPDFESYVLQKKMFETQDQKFPRDWERYTHRNKIIVDDVFDFGNLSENLRSALSRSGLRNETIELVKIPRLKSDIRKRSETPKYNAKTAGIVRRVFSNEIKMFGYTLPSQLTEH